MNRNFNIDSLKGVLILFVVIGHIPFNSFFIERPDIVGYFIQWFYFFHMPLFLAISVLFIKNKLDWMLKRASLILIPYFFWFFYGNKRLFFDNPFEFITALLIGNWGSLNSIIWFLPALFSLIFIFFIFYKFNKNIQYSILGISLIVFLLAKQIAEFHYNIPFGLDVAMYIFILALLVQKIYINQERFIKIKYIYLIIIIISTSCILFYFEPLKIHTKWHAIIDLAQFSVATTILGYISFIILNISLMVLFLKIKPLGLLTLISRYSFPIFLLHLIILYKIPSYVSVNSKILGFFILMLSFLLSIFIPIVLSKILMKISDKFKYIGMTK